jgi:WhiB family transcriptional regulator, redox-sensing transcriptional regulator
VSATNRRRIPVLDAVAESLTDRPPWQSRANCRGMGPALFFPRKGEPQGEAKAVCAGCVVRDDCQAFGLDEKWGIWGGASDRERRRIRSARARQIDEMRVAS